MTRKQKRNAVLAMLAFWAVRPSCGTAPQQGAGKQPYRTAPGANRRTSLQSLGVGLYVWHPERCGNPRRLAEAVARMGAGSVYLKGNDGRQPFRAPSQIAAYVGELHRRGIRVLLWGYSYANAPHGEAGTVIALLHGTEADGYVFDMEDAVETPAKRGQVARLLSRVRRHRDGCPACRRKLLGAAVFALPEQHPDFPYRQIIAEVDFASPMVYCRDMGRSVRQGVGETFRQWREWERRSGLSVPLVPLGQAYPGRGGSKSGDIAAFAQATRGYDAVAYWDLESVLKHRRQGEIRRAAQLRDRFREGRP